MRRTMVVVALLALLPACTAQRWQGVADGLAIMGSSMQSPQPQGLTMYEVGGWTFVEREGGAGLVCRQIGRMISCQ